MSSRQVVLTTRAVKKHTGYVKRVYRMSMKDLEAGGVYEGL